MMVDFQVYFEADDVQAAIVTCGGLCPGLNTVIREIVCALYHMYGVKKVLGINVSGSYGLIILMIFQTNSFSNVDWKGNECKFKRNPVL